MNNTHFEYIGDGYSVTIQYCDYQDCTEYLGVNYPSHYCWVHAPKAAKLVQDFTINRRNNPNKQ